MIVVAGGISRVAILDAALLSAERVPDAVAPAFRPRGPFDLKTGSRYAPSEARLPACATFLTGRMSSAICCVSICSNINLSNEAGKSLASGSHPAL